MASIELREVDLFHPIRSYKTKKRPYFSTARDQLVGGLLFEENTTAKLYLRSAILRIVEVNPTGTAQMLYNVNQALQERLRGATAKFLIAMGSESLDSISEEVWAELSYVGAYEVEDLKCFTTHDKKSPTRNSREG